MIPVKLNYEILDSRELFSINTAGINTAYGLGVISVHKHNYKARSE